MVEKFFLVFIFKVLWKTYSQVLPYFRKVVRGELAPHLSTNCKNNCYPNTSMFPQLLVFVISPNLLDGRLLKIPGIGHTPSANFHTQNICQVVDQRPPTIYVRISGGAPRTNQIGHSVEQRPRSGSFRMGSRFRFDSRPIETLGGCAQMSETNVGD
jgi:hypothetical protein